MDHSATSLPARLVVGIVGHRRLVRSADVERQAGAAIARVKGLVPPLRKTRLMLTALTALAEGADRLVAERILGEPGARLEVVLPMAREDYARDFSTPGSAEEFEAFLKRADAVHPLPSPPSSRAEAYARAGRYVVDHCDVLVALWDGLPEAGVGGTAEIVRYARTRQCPLVWVDPGPAGEIRLEPGKGLNAAALRSLDGYNAERAKEEDVASHGRDEMARLKRKAEAAGFALEGLKTAGGQILGFFGRADLLARRYRSRYFRAGTFVHVLAAMAVATAALQALFFPGLPRLALVELALIVAALAIVWAGNRKRWLEKWIDYRFLAERFRSALFLALSGIDLVSLRPPRHLSLSFTSRDWMVAAFLSIWNGIRVAALPAGVEEAGLKQFVIDAWIEDQIGYHRALAVRHRRRHTRLAVAAYGLFGVSFLAVLFHALGGGEPTLEKGLVFLAIVAPAAAAALGAIRTHREYLRNSLRSAEMAGHLIELKARMEASSGGADLARLVGQAEEIMLHENADWRVVVRFHELEPTA